jgi:uncharacterized protein YbjT (DUF2867 family)
MQIAILGGTGGIGGHVLDWALEAGHPVHALARSPQALAPAPGLTVIRGDALNADAVAQVVDGADAVVSALGPRGAKAPGLLAGAAANVVAAMQKTGATRLVCVSAAGAYVTGDPNMSWLIKAVLPRVLAGQFADVRQMEDVIRASGLDWTLVRATRLVNRPGTGRYRVSPDYAPRGGGKISRADVAHFIATALTEDAWPRAAPALAY